MKKKILFLITKGNWGGAQRYVYDLATSLSPDQFEVIVAYGEGAALASKLAGTNVRTIRLEATKNETSFAAIYAATKDVRALLAKERPDIVHINSSLAGIAGTLAGRLEHVPKIIFTAHGWAFNEDRPWLVRSIIFVLHWLTVILSHTTIAVSENVKRQITRAPFVKTKIVVVRNGVRDVSLLPKREARSALAEHNTALSQYTDGKNLWVGTVAELHPTKNLRYAIEAIDALRHEVPEVRYVIAGSGAQRAELEALVENRNLKEHAFLLGHVDDAPQYGSAYDIFLLPSRSEALNLAVLEAGQASLPVVATRVGGIPEIITNEETGLLIPPQDSEAIVGALTRLIADEPLQCRLGDGLRERVTRDFSLPRMLAETRTLYGRD